MFIKAIFREQVRVDVKTSNKKRLVFFFGTGILFSASIPEQGYKTVFLQAHPCWLAPR